MPGLNRKGRMTRVATAVLGRPKRAAPRHSRSRPRPKKSVASRRYRRTAAILPLVMVNSSFSLFDFGCWFVVFLISLSTHEAAHAFTAQRLGAVTGYLGGQVTLNPLPPTTREPYAMLIIPLLPHISSR